jgi:hypothetical protein
VALNNSGVIGTATTINSTSTAGVFGEVWLGFANTGGIWQAQYSTDGTTWNNVGSAVNHSTNFSRVGLNVFNRLNMATNTGYAGAFEWFSYTLAAPIFSQTSYRFLANPTNPPDTMPGSALAGNNTPYTLTSTGQQFRLRQLIKSSISTPASSQSFNEQYADLSTFGACSAMPSANWGSFNSGGSSAGPNFAANGSDNPSGATAWSNTSNITADDGSVASAIVNGIQGNSDELLAESFGFSIPSNATITGVTASFKKAKQGSSILIDQGVNLLKNGASAGASRGDLITDWPTSLTYIDYGGSFDLWGTTWTPADINSSGFGVEIFVGSNGTQNVTAQVDAVKITVNYSLNSLISYYDNPTPTSGGSISPTASDDPSEAGQTIAAQTYQESDGFTNPNTYGNSVDGMWDLSLFDNGAPAGTTYCFRTVKSDGTPLDTYTNYPMITTFSGGGPPTPTTDQLLRGGEWFSNGSKQSFFWVN